MSKKILSLFAGLFTVYCMYLPMRTINKIQKCTVIYPKRESYQETITTTGKIEVEKSNEIFIPVPVIAEKVNFEIGDKVKKGEVIAKIDVEKTMNILQNSITSVSSSIVSDGAIAETFKTTAERLGVNLSDLNVFNELSSKIKSVEKTKISTIPNELVAPTDGTITEITLRENSLCQASNAIAKIEDLTCKKAKLNVSEFDVAKVKMGQKVLITSGYTQEESIVGTVSKIYPTANAGSSGASNVLVEVQIDNCPETMKPGFNVTADILLNELETSYTLPYEVICQDANDMEYVYVLSKGRAKIVYIETGLEMPNAVQILNGVDKNTPILFNPNKLDSGELVLVKGV